MTLEEKQEAILLLKKTQALIKNLNEQSRKDRSLYVLMDADYNQYEVESENMGDAIHYLEDGMVCEVVFYNEKAISVELPTTVVREVTYTEPAVKGDTSGKVLKPAKIATGFEVSVPLFVAQGDKIEIDTRTGEYKRRV